MSWFQVQAGDEDGGADGADKGGAEGGIDRLAQVVAADLGQVGQGDADDQGGFNAFAERDDECLEHVDGHRSQVENEIQFQYQ